MKILTSINKDSQALMPSDQMGKRLYLHKPYKVIIPTRENGGKDIQLKRKKAYNWYTDGSKKENGSGVGIYGPNGNRKIPLGIHATNFKHKYVL